MQFLGSCLRLGGGANDEIADLHIGRLLDREGKAPFGFGAANRPKTFLNLAPLGTGKDCQTSVNNQNDSFSHISDWTES